MKQTLVIIFLFFTSVIIAQNDEDSTSYKKRVLESTEVDFLASYYTQDGNNASVTGGVGTEKLTDYTPTIVVSMPLNEDDVLTVDIGVSAYSSASSSNLDPFDGGTGASSGGGDDDDDEGNGTGYVTGSPWVESSGASSGDVWFSANVGYSHSSDDRNKIWGTNASFATEYDYTSIGFGGSYTHLFNEKNTEIGIKGNVYLDSWSPRYPTELDTYFEVGGNLRSGFFQNAPILNENLQVINDVNNNFSGQLWRPETADRGLISDKSRNTYALSLSFSQILSKRAQFSVFLDVIQQSGWLGNPTQRVYFADRPNYFIGGNHTFDGNGNLVTPDPNAVSGIANYTSPENRTVFQLADDIERLPDTRFKTPIGMRFNYYLNEKLTVRTYYRYYFDNWGINSHTASIELPIKLSDKFTLYPSYRYYTQTEADYFAPFDEHLSTSEFYTSDFDLSKYNANQYGFGVSYTDIFTKAHIWKLGIKSIDLKYNYYKRNTGLDANIISLGVKFILD